MAALVASEESTTPTVLAESSSTFRLPHNAFLSPPVAPPRSFAAASAPRYRVDAIPQPVRDAALAQTPRLRFVASAPTTNAESPQLTFDDSSDNSPRSIDEAFETTCDELQLLNVR